MNFSNPKNLLISLNKKGEHKIFLTKRNASDQRFLRILSNDKSVMSMINNSKTLKLLWEICSIPDYSKDLDEFHSRFLKKIFLFLVKEKNIPEAWIKMQLNLIKKKTNKISELNYKISQIRKWSYLSFKSNWIKQNLKFQKKIKKIENDLSVNLHNQLMSEFIEELKNFEIEKEEKKNSENIIRIDQKNKIFFGKLEIGKIVGFSIKIYSHFSNYKNNFLNKILKESLKDIAFKHIDFLKNRFSRNNI